MNSIVKYIKEKLVKGRRHDCDKLQDKVAQQIKKVIKKKRFNYKLVKQFESRSKDYVYLVKKDKKEYVLKILHSIIGIDEIARTIILSTIEKTMYSHIIDIGITHSLKPFDNNEQPDTNKEYYYMILEYNPSTSSVYNFVELAVSKGKQIPMRDMLEIIFQAYYALNYATKYCKKFYHNDLHPNNILVYKRKKTKIYNINGKKYKCKKYGISIIDYGHSKFMYKPRAVFTRFEPVLYKFTKLYKKSTVRYLINTARLLNIEADIMYLTLMLYAILENNEHSVKTLKCDNIEDCIQHPIFEPLLL